ncbi:MAG: hypothetical protein OEZ36_09620 [Spirochaetota bacterium]|nr:hypothetical protein [Spirochaetota bacterium]
MDPQDMNNLCKSCYHNDECPQPVWVSIIRCLSFRSTNLQRDLIKLTRTKKKK